MTTPQLEVASMATATLIIAEVLVMIDRHWYPSSVPKCVKEDLKHNTVKKITSGAYTDPLCTAVNTAEGM